MNFAWVSFVTDHMTSFSISRLGLVGMTWGSIVKGCESSYLFHLSCFGSGYVFIKWHNAFHLLH